MKKCENCEEWQGKIKGCKIAYREDMLRDGCGEDNDLKYWRNIEFNVEMCQKNGEAGPDNSGMCCLDKTIECICAGDEDYTWGCHRWS